MGLAAEHLDRAAAVLGAPLLIIVAAEFVAANEGIGWLIWIWWSTLSVSQSYAGILIIAVLGACSP